MSLEGILVDLQSSSFDSKVDRAIPSLAGVPWVARTPTQRTLRIWPSGMASSPRHDDVLEAWPQLNTYCAGEVNIYCFERRLPMDRVTQTRRRM